MYSITVFFLAIANRQVYITWLWTIRNISQNRLHRAEHVEAPGRLGLILSIYCMEPIPPSADAIMNKTECHTFNPDLYMQPS